MKLNRYRQNGKIGSFLAVNNGTVIGCAAEVSFAPRNGGSGFVYENNSRILHSVSIKCVRGKSAAGFYASNAGEITESGYLASSKARRVGKDGIETFTHGNGECYIPGNTHVREIQRKLGLDRVWKCTETQNGELVPDIIANRQTILEQDRPIIRIETADDLRAMARAINGGDSEAAHAQYLLINDINMRGAKLEPIGGDDSRPFSGKLDGNGKTIHNFIMDCRGAEYGGFFGYAQNAEVANLTMDYILRGNGGVNIGGMAGCIHGGCFSNCQVMLSMTPGMYAGGFCGKNAGTIQNCYVGGRIASPAPVLPWLISGAVILLALLAVGTVMLVHKLSGDVGFNPEIIDPNQVPVIRTNERDDPPPAGTNRISLELNHEVYVRASTMVGEMDYVNPYRSTQDVVIRLCISDAELEKAGYDPVACGARSRQEREAEDYDPEKAFTVLYRSQRLQIGYKLSYCKLSPLPNGETLRVGDYEMVMMIDAYDPETHEKSIVNAQAMTTIHVLDQ